MKPKSQNGRRDSAAQVVEHPHAQNRFAIVNMYGDYLKNEHGAVCGFRTREDAAQHIDATETQAPKRKNDVMVVLVKMSVSVPYTAEMRDEATRQEVVADIINLCKVGAQSHLTITGHTAEVS